MKRVSSEHVKSENDFIRAEYDFKKAVRGQHYKPLHDGYTVHIHKTDGTTVIENYKLAEGSVMLQPDVREYFPDSETVNMALRSLIAVMNKISPKIEPLSRRTT